MLLPAVFASHGVLKPGHALRSGSTAGARDHAELDWLHHELTGNCGTGNKVAHRVKNGILNALG